MKNLTTEQRSKLYKELYFERVGKNPNHIDEKILLIAKLNKNLIPFGMATEISKVCGVTRERVRQRVKALGLLPARKVSEIKNTKKCKNCKKTMFPPQKTKLFCSPECNKEYSLKHYYYKKHCKVCKKEFYVRKFLIDSKRNKGLYCSHKCWGVVAGNNYGAIGLKISAVRRTKFLYTKEFLLEHFSKDFTVKDFMDEFNILYINAGQRISGYRISGLIKRINSGVGKMAIYRII